MVYDGDPYRTLGLTRGASLDEVKRAYRRLAKINHPDAAGIGALPRFLAIQSAYEQLVEGPGGPGAIPRSPSGSPSRASAADPGRADATRRAYGGRARARRPAEETPGRAGPSRPAPGSRHDRSTAGGKSTAAGDAGADPRAGRSRGKATLGSTSYDDANAGPFEPDWGGASWYGTTSGTYWTINPKEYADPRKHGPEYQARARRATGGRPDANASEPPFTAGPEPDPDRPASGPTHTTSTWWDSTLGASEPEDDRPRTADSGRAAASRSAAGEATGSWSMGSDQVPDPAQALADLARALTDPRAGGLRGRIIRAFVGWLPIALGIGWLLGEITGCGRFAATCDPSVNPLILLVQGGALVVLLVLPLAASLAATAALSLVAAAVAATLVLSATGTAGDEASRRATLGLLLVVAWLAGLAIAVAHRLRSASARAGPVS